MKKNLLLTILLASGAGMMYAQCTAPTPSIVADGATTFCKGESVDVSVGTGGAIQVDGINGYLDCGNDPSVQLSGTHITLEAWIYPTAWKPNVWQGNIINKELDGPNEGYMLRAGGAGQLNFNLGGGADWVDLNSATGVLALNTWQHVAGTYDGSMVRLYLNGVEIASAPWTESFSSSSTNLCIGNWGLGLLWGTERHFQGKIDEARVYNITRTAAEIIADMSTTVPGDSPGLVAYYMMDEGAGALANDASVNNNNATVVSGATWEIPATSPVSGDEIVGWLWSPGGATTSTLNVTKAYDYTVTVTDATGCTATSAPFHVSVNKPPYSHIIPDGPLSFCMGESVTLNANTGTGLSYQWLKDEAPIGAATTSSYTATTEGVYRCRVTKDATGCSKESNKANVQITCREEGTETATALNVFPNPAGDNITIDAAALLNNATAKTYIIQITDITGKQYLQTESDASLQPIDISSLPAGMYNIQTTANGQWMSVAFIKQ